MIDLLWSTYVLPVVKILIHIGFILIPLLISVAYMIYAERKIIGAMQLRKGPSVVGWFGLLQPIADAIKLLNKETILPEKSNWIIFIAAPVVTFSLSLMAWAVIPFDEGWALSNLNVGILYIFAISSLGVYGIIMAGWSSNSKYAFLGAMRSAAQMISYEVSIGFVFLSILLCVGSLNLTDIVNYQKNSWFCVTMFPMLIVFFISALAETNRSPFDLPEAEAELVSGYNVEYSSMSFGMFFLGEYANMILMSVIGSILFFGGWLPPFDFKIFHMIPGFIWMGLKTSLLLFVFIWVRATLPRYRYDQLMRIGWKIFLPFTLVWVALTATFLVAFEYTPTPDLEELFRRFE